MTTDETLTALLQDLEARASAASSDLRAGETLALARALADVALGTLTRPDELWALEQASTAPDAQVGRVTQLAAKLARSRAFLVSAPRELFVSVVVPAYGENVRLLPRGDGPGQDPHGEDFVIQKSAQLEWLFAGTGSRYEVLVVDDMSKPEPETSGQAIEHLVETRGVPHFRVVYLEQGVRHEKEGDGLVARALRGVELPKNTRKAGAVYYGFAKAIEAHGSDEDHVIVLTDCDLSVDVGQVGNLVAPIVVGLAAAAAGSRRLPESVLEIEPGRNTRANAARYFRELLLTGLLPRDTQCGAKAFAASAMADLLGADEPMQVLDFSFDIELLSRVALTFGAEKIVPVPVAWFDSSELTTTDSSVHFGIMRAQLKIALSNATGAGPVFEDTAALAEKLTADEDGWLAFLDRLAADPPLLRRVETFDPEALPELDRIASPVVGT